MIQSIRHKGLKRLFEEDDSRGVIGEHVEKLKHLPGFRLHPLKGDQKGVWAVTVRANWRVTFRFVDGGAMDVDYVDYH